MNACVIFISLANTFSREKFCSTIVWFFTILISLCSLTLCIHSFSKSCVIHWLEKILFEIISCIFLSSVWISVYGFNIASSFNLMLLFTFLNTNPTIFYHPTWLQVFQLFHFSFFHVKK